MNLVFIADNPWHSLRQRPQHLAVRFARRWPVLWVQPMTLAHPGPRRPVEVAPNIRAVALPLFPLNARSAAVRRVARSLSGIPAARRALVRLQSALLRSAAAGGAEPTVVFLQNFQLIEAAEALAPERLVFDYIDNAFGFAEFPSHVRHDWERTVRRADAITATAPELARLIRAAELREVHLVPNGVEYARFAGEEGSAEPTRPADLPPPGRPVVGYMGSVYPWVDFELLGRLADAWPEAEVVLVGHAHPDVRDALATLLRRPNVRFLGVKPYEEVPHYLRHFDAGLIPFRRNVLTESVNPVKLYEYCAAGVPCVATDFAADLRQVGGVVSIAESHDRFIAFARAAVERKKDGGERRKLLEFARANDWDERARTLIALIEPGPGHAGSRAPHH
jgi:glycosyltransferase involved in cell wall biosynthesis